LCDEVGLGKTIEAGLVLRALILRGDLGRVLIIAPRSLIRQWMEELREKFALTAWFYDGRCLRDVGGRVRHTTQPWGEDGIIIVSRHLIARADRRADVLSTRRPWDAVLVDEAHAARRRGFGNNEPNMLLSLLQEFRARRLFGCLWLLTRRLCNLNHMRYTICSSCVAWITLRGDVGLRGQRFRGFSIGSVILVVSARYAPMSLP
jgi:hypothetical protein